MFGLWEEAGVPTENCKHTERPLLGLEPETETFLLWSTSANYQATVLPLSENIYIEKTYTFFII